MQPLLRIATPDAIAPVGDALSALGMGLTLVDREMRIQYANGFVREETSELSCGQDHCFSALWRRSQRCPDCLPLLVFRTGEPQEGVRERGRGGQPEAWRVRAIPVGDAAGQVAWVAECLVRLSPLLSDLAGRGSPLEPGGTALVVLDAEERIVSWSATATAILGWQVEEVLGRRVALVIPDDRLEEERAVSDRVAAEGRAPRYETVRRARDGRHVPVAVTSVALRGDAGERVGRTCLLEDSSALQALRGRVLQQEQLLAHITREAADAIVAVDREGRVTSWNRGAEQLLGYPAADMVGRELAFLGSTGGPLSRLLERARAGAPLRGVRMEWRDSKGEPLPVEVSAAVLGGELGSAGVALVARDLSARMRLDRQLVRSEKLALVGSLAAGLAHEIGTPLNVISATAEYLLPDAPPEAHDQLKGIVAETERISRLVHDLLSFARGGTPGRTGIGFPGAVDRVLSLLRITLDRKRVQVTTEIPLDLPPVHADPDGLHQVLLNLLVNASQAVPEGGRIAVTARTLEVEGERMVAFEVQDDGPGVAPELRERIFDPFFTTRAEGTGLGLAVCARIVADHGGDLRVGEAPLGGAAFAVQLPAEVEEGP